jgi:hypothetical protein
LDAEVLVAQERLIDLRAAAKTSAIEEQQDLLEEHAVASALQGLSMAPVPDRKPSAEEKEPKPDRKPSTSAEADTKPSGDAAELEASHECVICMDQPKSHIIVPCGHQCVCQACAERLTEEGETCPICRVAVTMIMAVYL